MFTIFEWFSYELPMKERYALIRKTGFDGVMLWWSEEFGRNYYFDAAPLAQKAGLFVENVHTSDKLINNIWLDNIEGNEMSRYFLRCVEECADYNIPTMVMHLSSGENPPPFNELGLNRIKQITEKAEKYSVNIAMENLRKIEYLEFVLENIKSSRIGFCYDSGHHNCHTPQINLLEKYGSRLMALHLHDNDGSDDQHLLPFDGTIDWLATMRDIAKTGYNDTIALEVDFAKNTGYDNLSAEEFLHIAFERAKKLEMT